MKCVVVPAKNEAVTIGALVRSARIFGADLVIVADDASTDATASAATDAGAVVLPVPTDRAGMAGVYVTGLRDALRRGADVIVEMDAGGSHDPAALTEFWDALTYDDADVAAGRRFGPEASYVGSRRRELLSRGGTLLTNFLHGTHFQDATSGYIAYRAAALDKLLTAPLKSRGHYYQTEMRLRAVTLGMRVVEVPIVYRNSSSSLNSTSIREALRLALL